ncbi:diguanylate cyclase [Acerihabitans arboris]|uniref:Diguanylate cyclase DosC n=1 Tax=Acerihabitans arboris TaxID=2691583 RepID=A0A845SIL5_9GAMM|nr:diguanylate cyclase [Acerihabitans arboris]NDL62471.1 diguanylate cyclase [Acerihabitans arboris]
MKLNGQYYDALIMKEWHDLIAITSDAAHNILISLLDEDIDLLVDDFYDSMLGDDDARLFLSSQQVKDRLHGTLAQWIRGVLSSSTADLPALVAVQRKVGDVHARIGIPIDLVARGARRVKISLYTRLRRDITDLTLCYDAMRFSSLVMDMAIEVMTTAYSRSHENSTKDKENYRLLSILDNVHVERERQLAAVLNWENRFIYNVATGLPLAEIAPLAEAEFGLWFQHKGRYVFESVDQVAAIEALLTGADAFIASYSAEKVAVVEERYILLRTVRSQVQKIGTLLAGLFDELAKFENGKDPLTNLLNRRFIPTILRREIALAMRSGTPFVMAMLDIDYFKSINDRFGHDAGDAALKDIAAILHESVRSSDYVFRYGGEEFMLLFVEASESQAIAIINSIRDRLENRPLHPSGGGKVSLTVSVGLCLFDGHPDYERLIKKADSALYLAKRNGRNRTETYRDGQPAAAGDEV